MTSYRVRRRAFMAGLGGAFGLGGLLANLEASAQGSPAPPRFLMVHWPLGTLRQRFLPVATNDNGFTISPILRPFEVAGLHDDMIVLFGLRHPFTSFGGGNEDGTVMAVTGANVPGTRENGGEADDGVAGGPSFDQIFLKHAPDLSRPGPGYANAIADARVFSYETSTVCLSYSYQTREIRAARGGTSGLVTEHTPLLPDRSPAALYARIFANLVPGGGPDDATRALRLRKSVLDSALLELTRLHDLAPSSEWEKLDLHAEAIRKLELELQAEIDGAANGCSPPGAPDASVSAKAGSSGITQEPSAAEDASFVARVGKLHASVIRAAFQCDLLRVATLEWCGGTNHVAFADMNPYDPAFIYEMGSLHYLGPQSPQFFQGAPPASGDSASFVYETLSNMYTWFSQQTADVLLDLKNAQDVFGQSVLDSTIVPYITEQADPSDMRAPLPAAIFGGRALGMQGGQFRNFVGALRSHNDLWMTIAQAYLKTTDPLGVLADEVFVKTDVAPIEGLWLPPA